METATLKTACVIARDERGDKLANLLLEHFSEVYVMASLTDCRKFLPGDDSGRLWPSRRMPPQVDVLLFHSGDAALWQASHIQATHIFEFNTPGSPAQRSQHIRPILRATAPHFAIAPRDIAELYSYVSGTRSSPPSMCFPAPALLPALWILCQGYRAAVTQQPAVSQSSWWLQGLDSPRASQVNHLEQLHREWEIAGLLQTAVEPIDRLLQAIVPPSAPANAVTPGLVEAAQQALAMYSSFADPIVGRSGDPSSTWETAEAEDQMIVAIRGQSPATATATVLATMLHCNLRLLNSTTETDLKAIAPYFKLAVPSILVLTDSQMAQLPILRLQGFRGAVLVVSAEPFAILKQKHRILRFGQGSHDTFEAPWLLESLRDRATQLVPLEPENLRLLQNELKESERLYESQILPCLERLQKSAASELDTKKITEIVSRLVATTPLACHEEVTIDDNSEPLLQHLELGVKELQTPSLRSQGIERLNAGFELWHRLVSSTGEYFSPSY
jgi:hypothetical protein